MMDRVQQLRILTGATQVGSSPFGNYDKPNRLLMLDQIEWSVRQPANFLNQQLTVKGVLVADNSVFANDMKLIATTNGGAGGTFKG